MLLLLGLLLPIRAFSDWGEDILDLRGKKVTEVRFSGNPLSESVKSKFRSLEGKELNPGSVRAMLLWFHENGGESFLDARALRVRGGVALSFHSNQRQKISSIQFTGNTTVTSATLLQQIELKEGQEFDNEVAEAAIQQLSLFYSKQGYLGSDIRHEFDSSTRKLNFVISEGEPTLLLSVGISPVTSVERKDIRERYESDLLRVFGLKAGDRIQRDKVLDGIQAVKDWLRDHDFLLARDPVLDYKVDEEGRVRLFLEIAYGSRIRYGFRGNKKFSYRELSSMVSDVKEISSGSDYLSAVRRRVLEAYKEIGFSNAKITTLVREDSQRGIRYVSLIVNEGSKIRIESLRIEGVYSMSQEEARDRFRELGTRLVQRDFFDEAGLTRAAELFAEDLRTRGYLSAKLEFVKHDFNQDRTKVRVQALFSEGIQTKVQSLEIVGASSFNEAEITGVFGVTEGEPFNIFAFEKGLVEIKRRYQEIGKLNAQIVNEASESIVRYNKDNSQAFLRVEIEEGPTFKVGEIVVRGNQQTHTRVILRELPFITGDVLTTPLLNEAEDFLRRLNLFSNVSVRQIENAQAENVKDILILVEETEPGSFDVIPGLRNDLGARLGLELGYSNLGGWNRSVNASAVFNRRLQDYYGRGDDGWRQPEFRFSLGFREPYLANWPVVFTTNLTVLRRQYSKFDANVRRITLGIKRELSRFLDGFIEYGYEQVDVRSARAPYTKEDERTDYIGSITPGFIIDSRVDNTGTKNPFNPTKGFYSVNRFEVASSMLGSAKNVAYYRTTSHNSTYYQPFDGIVLAFAMNIGWERSNAVSVDAATGQTVGQPIPNIKLFRMGGLGSIRGYNEDGIEVGSSRNINGVLGMINYRAEARIPIQGSFGTAVFLDAGNLMVDRLSFAPEKLRSSIGTGLRYNTAVGPVLLDFAWRLQSDPRVGDTCVTEQGLRDRDCAQKPTDRYKIHFAIGIF